MNLKGNSTFVLIVNLLITVLIVVGLIYFDERYCTKTFGDTLKVYSTCYHMIIGLGFIYYGLTLFGRLGAKIFKFKSKGNI